MAKASISQLNFCYKLLFAFLKVLIQQPTGDAVVMYLLPETKGKLSLKSFFLCFVLNLGVHIRNVKSCSNTAQG